VDGHNRIYEITKQGGNDIIEGQSVQKEWFYLTKRFDWGASGRSNSFEVKRYIGGQLWVSGIRDRITLGVDYRPDNLPCWKWAHQAEEIGPDFGDDFTFSQPRYKRIRMGTPESGCEPGSINPVNHGAQHQFMVYGKGEARVDRMRIAVSAVGDKDIPTPDCRVDDPKIAIDCKVENDYAYSIRGSVELPHTIDPPHVHAD
jgi:hypothetical protein